MSRLWDVYTKLPVGWRFGGWMKVDNEPMDIEPIVGTIWGYGDNIRGLVSYRTNPFSVDGSTDSLIGGFAYSASDTKMELSIKQVVVHLLVMVMVFTFNRWCTKLD